MAESSRSQVFREGLLEGQVCLVSGAGSGLGREISLELARLGAVVVGCGRRSEPLAETAELAAGLPGSFEHRELDIREADAVDALVDGVLERHGRLDVLVNNAGVGVGALVADIETKRLDMQLAVNLRSVILFYREAASLLRAAGAEHGNALVVNTSSISGKSGEPWLSVYSATKAAVVGFTESMNKELGQDGIKSTALCPAFVDTPMTDFIKQSVPAESMIQADDVAEAVRMLLRLSPGCVIPEVIFQAPGSVPAGLPA
jgi:NAD(P)-dependent dehydrogenase (short-subunit alcohol dehydrogenase family)